jgi:hypothetical protein
MGKKAKLKQQRKEIVNQSDPNIPPKNKYNSTQFVEEIQRQGYTLKKDSFNAPDLPDDYVEPQI